MQPEYLVRLAEPLRELVSEIERNAGIDIAVVLDPRLNGGGPHGQGQLEVIIEAQRNLLCAPTNGYFPDGAVRHELLHLKRFHVEGVPKLALADAEEWDQAFTDALAELDNAIEHVLIVPEELHFHPERREHWEAVMRNVCGGLPGVPLGERSLAVCLHWTFLRCVLPLSPSVDTAKRFAEKHALLEVADRFADQFQSVATSKERIVDLLCLTFPEFPKNRVALEYVNSVTGSRQERLT